MHAVRLIELGVAGHALKKERIQNRAVGRGKVRIHRVEALGIVRAHVARRVHAGEQHGDLALFQLGQRGLERFLGQRGIEAPQGVIGAQFGARVGQNIRGDQLRALLGLLVLAVALRFLVGLVIAPAQRYATTLLSGGGL